VPAIVPRLPETARSQPFEPPNSVLSHTTAASTWSGGRYRYPKRRTSSDGSITERPAQERQIEKQKPPRVAVRYRISSIPGASCSTVACYNAVFSFSERRSNDFFHR
jgi:hypothetical protein